MADAGVIPAADTAGALQGEPGGVQRQALLPDRQGDALAGGQFQCLADSDGPVVVDLVGSVPGRAGVQVPAHVQDAVQADAVQVGQTTMVGPGQQDRAVLCAQHGVLALALYGDVFMAGHLFRAVAADGDGGVLADGVGPVAADLAGVVVGDGGEPVVADRLNRIVFHLVELIPFGMQPKLLLSALVVEAQGVGVVPAALLSLGVLQAARQNAALAGVGR